MVKFKISKNLNFNRETAFQFFKYTVYIFLSMNIYHFFVDDYSASSQTFAGGIAPSQIIQAFAATIDTIAWVVLLLIFELETYVLDDKKLKGPLKWSLRFFSLLCYCFIIYSFYGYISKYILLHTALPFNGDICGLVGTTFTYLYEIDDYIPITKEVCQSYINLSLSQIAGTEIIASQANLIEAQRLSTVEVINSANWLIIVFILESEVYLQLKGRLTDSIMFISKWIKVALYSVLLIAAIYWGIKGSFLDFWDAFLWLVAFIFIELNIFEWNAETSKDKVLEPST
ncbi:MAG: hypothetical protein ACI9N9_000362 [Enterobacterales bacterium]|jgi:hypothetical protein